MRKRSEVLDMMDRLFTPAARRGLLYCEAEAVGADGRTVRLGGRDLVQFSSCSYLGLETHPALKQGAIAAIERYGTQFSASRAAISCPLYAELEDLLADLFGTPALVAPTTTLAHAAALPVIVDERDAVILDQQVHASVMASIDHAIVQGTHVEVLRHNRLDLLEARIRDLRQRHRKVWYLGDGVYSMHGDLAPMSGLAELLDRYECLNLYMDDAHGMSWTGPHGRGYVLAQLPRHERMIVATSFAKAFGVGGGVLVVPDAETRRRLRTVGSSFTFSGPLQPANLGAAIASAGLHLSGEVARLQAELAARMARWNSLCEAHGLPLASKADVPIRFIGTGRPQVAYALVARMMEEGFFPTLSVFPTVPMKQAGVRFALNLHQTDDDLERAVAAIAHHLPRELAREGSSLAEVQAAFDLAPPPGPGPADAPARLVEAAPAAGLSLEHHPTAAALDAQEWDRLLGSQGTYDVNGLLFLEAAFTGNPEPENNWRFHYLIVRDADRRPVLATFFTAARWKDDLLAPADVSREVEARRVQDPGFLTSEAVTMGSLLSEGAHLWLDRARDWRGALDLVLRTMEREQARLGADHLVVRDVQASDHEVQDVLTERGFARVPMPESLTLELDWADDAAYMAKLSAKARLHQRKKVLPFDGWYDEAIRDRRATALSPALHAHLYALYEAVAARNLDFNAFRLPRKLFATMLGHPRWEIMALSLRAPHDAGTDGLPVAFMASYRGDDHYVPLVCGLDYRYVTSHGAYRQLLRRTIMRAWREGFTRIHFGIGAAHEKTRFGCKARQSHVFMQSSDGYAMEVLGQMMKTVRR